MIGLITNDRPYALTYNVINTIFLLYNSNKYYYAMTYFIRQHNVSYPFNFLILLRVSLINNYVLDTIGSESPILIKVSYLMNYSRGPPRKTAG